MIVRCTANTGMNLTAAQLRRGRTSQTEFPLMLNKEYAVYGMCIYEGALDFLVCEGSGGPHWSPAELFEIIDNRLPGDWHFKSWDSDLSGVWGYRELVMNREYFDQLAEHDYPAVEHFYVMREEILRRAKSDEDS